MNRIKLAQYIAKSIRIFHKKSYLNFLIRLFSTPPKPRNTPLDTNLKLNITTEKLAANLYSRDNLQFTRYKKLCSRTVIVFAHGWGGSFQNFKYFIQPALDRNISVIGFDAPAHGISGGKRTHIHAFKECVQLCLQEVQDFDKVIVIGQSLGAAAATLAIMETPEVKIKHLFYLAGPSDLRKIMDDFSALMDVSTKDASKMQQYIKQKINLDFEADNWRKKQLPEHLNNVLLVHGRKDEVVKIEECLALAKAWGLDEGRDVRIIADAGHYNTLKSKVAIEEIFSKIDQFIDF